MPNQSSSRLSALTAAVVLALSTQALAQDAPPQISWRSVSTDGYSYNQCVVVEPESLPDDALIRGNALDVRNGIVEYPQPDGSVKEKLEESTIGKAYAALVKNSNANSLDAVSNNVYIRDKSSVSRVSGTSVENSNFSQSLKMRSNQIDIKGNSLVDSAIASSISNVRTGSLDLSENKVVTNLTDLSDGRTATVSAVSISESSAEKATILKNELNLKNNSHIFNAAHVVQIDKKSNLQKTTLSNNKLTLSEKATIEGNAGILMSDSENTWFDLISRLFNLFGELSGIPLIPSKAGSDPTLCTFP